MDIYPVVCYKVDENGQTIEVSNTDQLAPIVGDPPHENYQESNFNINFDKNETDVHHDNVENHIKTELLHQQYFDLGEQCIDPGGLCGVNITNTDLNENEGETLTISRKCDKPVETTRPQTFEDWKAGAMQLYPEEHSPRKLLESGDRIFMIKRLKRIGCLFKCLAQGMFGDTSSHTQVRQNIVMSIYNNWDTHKEFAMQDSTVYNRKIQNKDDYFIYMSQNKVQGGILELRVATAIFNIYIELINIREQTVQRFGACIKRKQKVQLFFDTILCTFDFVEQIAPRKYISKTKISRQKSNKKNPNPSSHDKKSRESLKKKNIII